jgi:hypothetical protein
LGFYLTMNTCSLIEEVYKLSFNMLETFIYKFVIFSS